MKILHYATIIGYACFFAGSIAAPVDGSRSDAAVDVTQTAAEHSRQLERREPKPPDTKYFHEPGGDDILGHYDIRYFHGVVSYEERTDTLQHLIRSYLIFFREKGIETWIAHGTLLGWWWNGKMLPWDWDVDTQVSGATLEYLGKNFNRTIHHYVSTDIEVERDYLLDVNPWSRERERGDGMNIIDARWIDVRNGLYIDITGLSETHPDTLPGVWSCKNYHRYKTSDLYPMRESLYEGVPAKIPYAYDKILQEEYQKKALVLTEYEGHRWESHLKEWVKTPEQQQKEEEEARKKLEEAEKAKEEEARKKLEEAEKTKEEESRKLEEEEKPGEKQDAQSEKE